MIPARRERFTRAFTGPGYDAFLAALRRAAGAPVEFRVSETPCFLPAALMDALAAAAQTLVASLLGDPAYRAAADAAVPAAFRLPRGEAAPTFVQVDFGLVRTDAGLEGRLVELQAFPSLHGFQLVLAETYAAHWGIAGVTPFLGGLDRDAYLRACGDAIVGACDPREVVLIDVAPERQKTRPDFAVTERLWGVRTVDVRDVVREGRRLVDATGGRRRPIARVYNRVIPDELARSGVRPGFGYADDLDVEWVGGPDWFFRISKFSLPWLRHPWVPESHRLDRVDTLPGPREDWILKPLFSFAGGGIVFAPSDAEIAAIPGARRHEYLLQRRMAFTPVIDTPAGPTQVEVRVMLVARGDGYLPLMPLLRMGRGRMMGVDHTAGLTWVGASAALMEPADPDRMTR